MVMRFFFAFLLVFLATRSFSQIDKPLAVIGDKIITASDFEQKWETTPQPGREQEGPMTESKQRLLKTMVAEKILANYARSRRLDTLWSVQRLRKSIEEIFVRDQVFKADIESKVSISPEMLAEAERRGSLVYEIKFVHYPSYDSALFMYSLLKLGADFDSLLATRPERMEQTNKLMVAFGSLEKPVEDAVFSIQKPGEYSKPVERPEGWFVFKIISIKPFIAEPGKDDFSRKRQVRDMLHLRESTMYYRDFYKSFLKDKEISTDRKLFQQLLTKVYERLIPKVQAHGPKEISNVGFSDSDISEIEKEFGPDLLKKPYIKYPPAPVSLKDFLWDLQFRGWNITTADKEKIRNLFLEINETMARDAAINHEGYLRGYHELPEVKKRVEEYFDYFLSERVKGRLADSVQVQEADVEKYYNEQLTKKADSVLINVVEVQVLNSDKSFSILNEFREGKSMQDLFRQYNENPGRKQENGETGWFMPSQRGQVGAELSRLNLFDIYGPVKSGKYTSVFQLIGKKTISNFAKPDMPPFEEVKGEMSREVFEKRFYQSLSTLTAGLATRYQVTVDLELLKEIEVTSVNMAAFQEMGFGGKILYLPYTVNFDQWYEEWKKQPVNP